MNAAKVSAAIYLVTLALSTYMMRGEAVQDRIDVGIFMVCMGIYWLMWAIGSVIEDFKAERED